MRLWHILAVFLLSGCATGGDQFVRAPYLEAVSLRVKWHNTEAEARAACDKSGTWLGYGRQYEACSRVYVASDQVAIATLFLVRPTSFDGPEACRAGHELYHTLGALHRKRRRREGWLICRGRHYYTINPAQAGKGY